MKNNTKLVLKFFQKLENKDKSILDLLHDDFNQGNTLDEKAIFEKILNDKNYPTIKTNVVRFIEEDDRVVVHSNIKVNNKDMVSIDLFKIKDEKIIWHFDSILDKAPLNPSNRSQTDGETEIKDLNKTQENKKLVETFIDEIWYKEEFNKMASFFDGDKFLQHNPMVGDGLSSLNKTLEEFAKKGLSVVYKNKFPITTAEGNFVAVFNDGIFGEHFISFTDIFRVENNKIVEHWDIKALTKPDKHKNIARALGKFNTNFNK